MKGDKIPDSDHVSRYCGGSQKNEDGSINGAAFRLRENEEYLSVNWLDFLNLLDRDAEIDEIRSVLGSKLKLAKNARIAILNVGEMINYVAVESLDERKLRILHEPEEPDDLSHSGIFNLRQDDDLIADLIAEIIQDSYPAIG